MTPRNSAPLLVVRSYDIGKSADVYAVIDPAYAERWSDAAEELGPYADGNWKDSSEQQRSDVLERFQEFYSLVFSVTNQYKEEQLSLTQLPAGAKDLSAPNDPTKLISSTFAYLAAAGAIVNDTVRPGYFKPNSQWRLFLGRIDFAFAYKEKPTPHVSGYLNDAKCSGLSNACLAASFVAAGLQFNIFHPNIASIEPTAFSYSWTEKTLTSTDSRPPYEKLARKVTYTLAGTDHRSYISGLGNPALVTLHKGDLADIAAGKYKLAETPER